MPADSPALPQRRSRFWLLAPFCLLGLIVAGWSTAWLMIRDQTSRALDDWIGNEAARGRQWTCGSRSVGGFPFRIEINCDSLSLQRPDFRLTVGPVTAIAQVYQPRHLIADVGGPLRASNGPFGADGTWRRLQASIHTTPEGLQRASLAADGPSFRMTGLASGDVDLSGEHLETHLRPDPTRAAADGAYDWSFQGTKLAIPGLDVLIGGTEPADLTLELTATQARDVAARPVADELEHWREAGGRIEIGRLTLAKGARRLEGKGQFGLDDVHRLQGRAELAAGGLEGLLGTVLGAGTGATAALLGVLTGRKRVDSEATPSGEARGSNSALKPLPPLRIEGGRIQLGPLPVPGLRVPPLY
jgi:hypothetical protein